MTADVDRLLEECAVHGRDEAEGGEAHGDQAEPDAGEDALPGDGERPPSDPHGVGDPADPVDEDDRVRGLRSDGRARGSHGDSDIGERERRSVVDAVADHDDRAQAGVLLDGANELQLLLGGLLGVDPVDADLASDLVGDASAIARRHGDVANACLSQVFRRARLASGRRWSAMTIAPASRPSTPTRILARPAPFALSSARMALGGRDSRVPASQDSLPTATRRPSTRPSAPCPAPSSTSSGKLRSRPRRRAPSTSASAREWAESWSTEAASRSISVPVRSSEGHDLFDLRRARA